MHLWVDFNERDLLIPFAFITGCFSFSIPNELRDGIVRVSLFHRLPPTQWWLERKKKRGKKQQLAVPYGRKTGSTLKTSQTQTSIRMLRNPAIRCLSLFRHLLVALLRVWSTTALPPPGAAFNPACPPEESPRTPCVHSLTLSFLLARTGW